MRLSYTEAGTSSWKSAASRALGIIAGACAEDVGLDRVGERGGEGEFVIGELRVELVKGALADLRVALLEEGREAALRKRALISLLVGEHAKFHVHVCELRECLVVPRHRAGAERKQALLGAAERMRLEAADPFQVNPPLREHGIGEETGEHLVVDGLDLRHDE